MSNLILGKFALEHLYYSTLPLWLVFPSQGKDVVLSFKYFASPGESGGEREGSSLKNQGLPTFAWVNMKVERSSVPFFVRRGKGEVAFPEPSMVDPVMG